MIEVRGESLNSKEIKDFLDNSLKTAEDPEALTLGNFYKLYSKERDYHEIALYKFFQDKTLSKKLLENLFPNEDTSNLKIVNVKKEKPYNIDIYFDIVSSADNLVKHPVIIELKTNTDNHDGQLTRYYKKIKTKVNSPLCFYITLNGKSPLVNDSENPEIVKYYTPLKYFDLIKNIDEEKDIAEENSAKNIFKDYIKTVKTNDLGCSPSLPYSLQAISVPSLSQAFFYFYCFKKIKTQLKERYDISVDYECWYIEPDGNGKPTKNNKQLFFAYENEKDKNLFLATKEKDKIINDSDFKNNFIYLKLIFKKKNGKLALEKRWQRGNSSLIYGIHDDIENIAIYQKLIDYWALSKDERTFKKHIFHDSEINRKLDMFSGGHKKEQVPKEYIVAQILNLEMNYLKYGRIINGITDIDTWVDRIKEDLDRIQ